MPEASPPRSFSTATALVLVACAVVSTLHQATHWEWFIEDAAICFAYARNIAMGEGAVAVWGGERVEAFSNPTWVALLTLFHALGVDGWWSAKPLAMAFGVGSVWVSWQIAREAMPDRRDHAALVAPILVALNAQLAIWSASGLENGLFAFLLGGAIWRTAVEARVGGAPWSAAWFLLLVWTRPEGLFYVVAGAGWQVATRWRAPGGFRSAAAWLAILLVPSFGLEAGRLAYFAWPLPNTYYAKVEAPWIWVLEWHARGWWQLRWWADRLWVGWWAPVYVVGLSGLSGRRARVAAAVVLAVAMLLAWPGPDDLRQLALWPALPDPPDLYLRVRSVAILLAGAALPWLALGTSGGVARGLCGHTLWVGLAFAVAADGDWMGGFRWMSLIAVPGSVLLAVGLVAVVDRIELAASGASSWRSAGWIAAAFAVGLAIPPNFTMTREHLLYNQDVTPTMIKQRVDYFQAIAARTFHEGPVRNLDIDQGAFLWWAPEFRQHDLAELVDVPLARHWWQQRAFVREYLFQEVRPTLVNIGIENGWTKISGLHRSYPEWQEQLFMLPHYIMADGQWFVGMFAQRSLVMTDRWEHPVDRRVDWEGGWSLAGLDAPLPWATGGHGYLEAPVINHEHRVRAETVSMVGFLAGQGQLITWDLPLGYGYYPLEEWVPGQVFRGRHPLPVPAGLPPGTYDFGVVLFLATGVAAPTRVPPGAVIGGQDGVAAIVAAGEVRFPGLVVVEGPEAAAARRAATLAELTSRAASDDCEGAETAWRQVVRLLSGDRLAQAEARGGIAGGIAACWARKAEREPDRAVAWLERAHDWDHRSEELARVGRPVAESLLAEAHAARAAGDWEIAYRRFSDVLRFEPWRAWARRYAEEARDHRLGLQDDVRIGRNGHEDELMAWEAEQAARQGASP